MSNKRARRAPETPPAPPELTVVPAGPPESEPGTGHRALGTEAERLTEADLVLFRPALFMAQQSHGQLQQAQVQLAQAQVQTHQADGALQYVWNVLAPRYELTPQDQIQEDGTILRGGAPA